jgi:hypothetical protein
MKHGSWGVVISRVSLPRHLPRQRNGAEGRVAEWLAVAAGEHDGGALAVDPTLLDGSGELVHQAPAAPSLDTPDPPRSVCKALPLELDEPGPVQAVEDD